MHVDKKFLHHSKTKLNFTSDLSDMVLMICFKYKVKIEIRLKNRFFIDIEIMILNPSLSFEFLRYCIILIYLEYVFKFILLNTGTACLSYLWTSRLNCKVSYTWSLYLWFWPMQFYLILKTRLIACLTSMWNKYKINTDQNINNVDKRLDNRSPCVFVSLFNCRL